MTNFISQEEYDEFMDEAPTDPFVDLTYVQRLLDSTESVVAEFTGRAQVLGYHADQPQTWMERLELELGDTAVEVDEAMVMSESQSQ